MRLHRHLKNFCWFILAIWACTLAAQRARRHADGLQIGVRVSLADSVPTMGGDVIPMNPPDSMVAILVTTAECDRGRLGVRSFRHLETVLRDTGIAFRVVVKSPPSSAGLYVRLLPAPRLAINDPNGSALGSANTDVVPTLLLIRPDGVLVGLWMPFPISPEGSGPAAEEVLRAASSSIYTPS